MGNTQSYDPSHIRIYNNLLAMTNPATRIQMIETLMVGSEYVASARRAGIYAGLLQYVRSVRAGESAQLPGERTPPRAAAGGSGSPAAAAVAAIQQYHAPQQPAWQVVTATPTNKALNYFQQCLLVLGVNENESLTDEQLKLAYKKAAVRAHPDKGGSEQQFEAVTRAYAYLSEILQRVKGTKKTTGALDAPAVTAEVREGETKRWEHVKPVRIDPKNVNMTTFNSMFEQTRLPDPDDDGYGDWLKGQEEESGPKFSGKFNRDVFMRTFEEEARKKAEQTNLIVHPELMALNSSAAGVELGREKPATFTAPANAALKYTDLRDAYTKENTISPYVANVRVEERNLKDYKESYKAGPAAMGASELAQLEQEKQRREQAETIRQRRAAEEHIAAQAYFERMKQFVLTK